MSKTSTTISSKKLARKTSRKKGLDFAIKRYFTKTRTHPYDEVKWEKRKISIPGPNETLVDAKAEFPKFWSQNAANIVGAKYLRGHGKKREASVKQMITRVAHTIRSWGEESGYFDSKREAQTFEDELTHLILHQKASFNSPVWFNVGIKESPQCSACFILNVEDDMGSIMNWIKTEAMIFKGGSGAGVNLSKLRSSKEALTAGGYSSGPVSFMRGADSVAGMIASGGATRRAAKMVLMDIEHPDVLEFIQCKAEEEKKVRALMSAGYNMQDLNDPAWKSIQYQNANNSVRLSDEFLNAVEGDKDWKTKYILSGKVAETHKARELMKEIAQASWESADPGVHYKTTINKWHTCPNTGPIDACNPCSEYLHLSNSACNLASINLIKYLNNDGSFKVKDFIHTINIIILAQEIMVGHASYPTEKIEQNAHDYRQLGMGFANIGGFLMAKGIVYDSAEGRAWAGTISALMSGEAYRMSALIASKMGSYTGYEINKEPQLNVIAMHREKVGEIDNNLVNDKELFKATKKTWDETLSLAKKHGVRNSQVSVIAPTGTISFMMDCTCTGIEPLFAPLVYKRLVGGGVMKLTAETIPMALEKLGYKKAQIKRISKWIEEKGTIEGASDLKEEHFPIFDCAIASGDGVRSISWQGHLKMMSAVQPFLSGAISKTINMKEDVSVEEIMAAYMMSWKLGLKSVAVYRDGCKTAQALSTKKGKDKEDKVQLTLETGPQQQRLPSVRSSETHKFSIAGHKGFITYSMYDDGKLAELFIRMAKQGSTLAGLLDTFAIAISMSLQHGVPIKKLCHKFVYGRYEPMGFTDNPDVQVATSITDYIFRYLALRFLAEEELAEFGMNGKTSGHLDAGLSDIKLEENLALKKEPAAVSANKNTNSIYADTVCKICGGMMIRTGTCLTCTQCGEASGGCS